MSATTSISCIRAAASTPKEVQHGFYAAYREAFGVEPYFEKYTDAELRDIWDHHIKWGVLILAKSGANVVGFGGALPLHSAPDDVRKFVNDRKDAGAVSFSPDHTWYISELGVLPSHWRRRIGVTITAKKLEIIHGFGGTEFVLRTAAHGSNSLPLYKKLGAVTIPGAPQDVSATRQVQHNNSHSLERVYLHGACSEAIARANALIAS